MQEAYTILGQILAGACSPNFEIARINASLDDGFTDVEYTCIINQQETFALPAKGKGSVVHDALHEIRKSMTIPGQEPWSRCTFTLFPDGKFKFDVEYDD